MKQVLALAATESQLIALYNKLNDLQDGLGDQFDKDYRAACLKLERFPEIAPRYEGRLRRLLLLKWHVGLFYAIEDGRVMIHAALDLRQAPSHIRRQLGLI